MLPTDLAGVPIFRLLHVAAAVLLVVGIAGRDLNLRRAARSSAITRTVQLVARAGRFEALMVRPGSLIVLGAGLALMWLQGRPFIAPGGYWLTVSILLYLSSIPIIAFVFVPRGRRFEAALREAEARGAPTAELAESFADPAVAFARRFEIVALVIVVALMIAKPF